MDLMGRKNSLGGLEAMASRLEILAKRIKTDNRVTAEDKGAIVKQIEALRKKMRKGADDLIYDNQQLLADTFRQAMHIMTDLISAKSIKGDDTAQLLKLNGQIAKVMKSLSFGSDADEDQDGDGFKDDEMEGIDFGGDDEADPKSKFHDAVKKALSPSTKPPVKDEKKEEEKETKKPEKAEKKAEKPSKSDNIKEEDEEDNEKEEPSENEEKEEKSEKKPLKKVKPKSKSEKEEKAKNGGFMDSLDEEATSSLHEVTAGLRFAYIGIKKIKIKGEVVQVAKAVYGDNHKPTATVYYYRPTEKLLGGNIEKLDKAFKKTLAEKNGYHALAVFIPKLVKSGKLIQVKKKDVDVTSEINKDPGEGFWSYMGIQEHPIKDSKKAIWFEIGDTQFAAIPNKLFLKGDIYEVDRYIKIKITGNKEAAGMSYVNGLEKLNGLVASKKLKIIFHAGV